MRNGILAVVTERCIQATNSFELASNDRTKVKSASMSDMKELKEEMEIQEKKITMHETMHTIN